MSTKSWSIVCSNLQYKLGQDLLDIQYWQVELRYFVQTQETMYINPYCFGGGGILFYVTQKLVFSP